MYSALVQLGLDFFIEDGSMEKRIEEFTIRLF